MSTAPTNNITYWNISWKLLLSPICFTSHYQVIFILNMRNHLGLFKNFNSHQLMINHFPAEQARKKILAHKIEKKIFKGSPCLMPLLGSIEPLMFPFIKISKITKFNQFIINNLSSSHKLQASKIRAIKPHSIWSYAFSISSLGNISLSFPLCLLILWTISWAMTVFSAVHLSTTKATWFGDIILESTFLNWSVTIFDTIFYKIISPKWIKFSGFMIFAMSTINILFIPFKILLVWKISCTKYTSWSLTKSQKNW